MTDEILVDRWAVMEFTLASLVATHDSYTGAIDPSCPDLDAAYNITTDDGGLAVDHLSNDTRCPNPVDHVILGIRTERAVDLFSLDDGEIVLGHFRVSVPGPPTQSGSRLWRPLDTFSYGAWEKVTNLEADPDGNIITIRTKADENGAHLADLFDANAKGPSSKRRVGTYDLPIEIKLKHVPVP